jgi:alpha-1,3-rhamnosyl/mannosyltransferase
LLEAVALMQGKRRDAPLLVLAGGDRKWKPQILRQVCALKIEDSVAWLDTLSDAHLADLYSAAQMTVVPSFEEGFGLPVIESMACGTPVICSEAASLPEVAGDAALFISPHSPEQLADAIDHLLHASDTRQRLIASGFSRSALFSQQTFIDRQASAIRTLLPSQSTKESSVIAVGRTIY